jgi:hypothetical protein
MKRRRNVCKCGHADSSHVWDGERFPCEKCPSVACPDFQGAIEGARPLRAALARPGVRAETKETPG